MRFTKHNKSTIDTLFLLALLGVFLVSVLFVILFGARIYKKTTAQSDKNFNIRTSVAYITEKIRKADGNNITVSDNSRIEINENIGSFAYVTYLYFDEGRIKEVTMLEGDTFYEDYGTAIISANSFSATKINNLIKVSIVTTDNDETVFYIAANPKGGISDEK